MFNTVKKSSSECKTFGHFFFQFLEVWSYNLYYMTSLLVLLSSFFFSFLEYLTSTGASGGHLLFTICVYYFYYMISLPFLKRIKVPKQSICRGINRNNSIFKWIYNWISFYFKKKSSAVCLVTFRQQHKRAKLAPWEDEFCSPVFSVHTPNCPK